MRAALRDSSNGGEACVDVLGLDRDDAAVVAGGSDLGRRIVSACGERQQFGLAGR